MKTGRLIAPSIIAATLSVASGAAFSEPPFAGTAAKIQAGQSLSESPARYIQGFENWMDSLADDAVMEVIDSSTGVRKTLSGKARIRDYYENAPETLLAYRSLDAQGGTPSDPNELRWELNGTAKVGAYGTVHNQSYTAKLRMKDGKLAYYYWRWEPIRVPEAIESLERLER
jgi:ketosteroid isomerase-like protein